MPDEPSVPQEKPRQEFLPREESLIAADEKAYETMPESKDVFLEEAPVSKPFEKVPPKAAPPPAPAAPKDKTTLEVEKILEEGLGALYQSLPETAKPKFKQKGEQAAREITDMVRALKLKFRRALRLIRDWLMTIPGVNRFFLEQEAKLKVDKLQALVEAKRQERIKQP